MNRHKSLKLIVTTVLMLAMMIASTATAFAEDFTGTAGANLTTDPVIVTGTIQATTIKVTHPLLASWTVAPDTGAFTGSTFNITNNTTAPVNVTVDGLNVQTAGFTDVAMDSKDWANLTKAETKQFIALALERGTGAWIGTAPATYWSANASSSLMGKLNPGTAGQLEISEVRTGKAVSTNITATHNLELTFALA